MMAWQTLVGVCLTVACTMLAVAVSAAPERAGTPPPNGPADVQWDARQGTLKLTCHGTAILDATAVALDKDGKKIQAAVEMEPKEEPGNKVEQRLRFVLVTPQEGVELVLRGTVTGSEEAFPAETRSEAQKRFRHVRNSVGLSRTLRLWDVAAREELGPDVYILACWGVHPSLNVIGLVDGCRLGSDGFGTAEFQRFNSSNGVVWRNDPDHCDIMGEYYMDADAMMPVFATKAPVPVRTIIRPALCTMAGGVLMVSDKVEVYKDDLRLEGMKRSAPVLFTVPGMLYDYSPRGRGHYHAGLHGGEATWWMLEIDRPFDHWSVLARFQWGKRKGQKHEWELQGVSEQEISFVDLGLPDDREYLVLEFWTQTFLGKFKGSFTAPAQDASNGLQVFALREARAHPWVISTTRRISQGGVSLLAEAWDSKRAVLSGRSAVVTGDPHVLSVHVPAGYRLKDAEVSGEKAETQVEEAAASVRIVPSATKVVNWRIQSAN